jgi:hypothetical protein
LPVDRFALTANNITTAWSAQSSATGTSSGGGRLGVIPSGFADVAERASRGYGRTPVWLFPMGTHLVIVPARVSAERLFDGAAHRAALPPVYNAYARTRAEAHYDPSMDDERMLLLPLYATSFCLYDYLAEKNWFGADQLVILSASSKTAIGLALALAEDAAAPPAIALTSPRNREAVGRLGLYARVLEYADLGSIDGGAPTVIVDMSGSGPLLSALHAHLGDNMRYCANVGVTHYSENRMGPGFIAERSAMFFAPAHIQQRARDWGPGAFEKKAFNFWRDAAQKSRAWLKLERERGIAAAQPAYHRVLNGETARIEALSSSWDQWLLFLEDSQPAEDEDQQRGADQRYQETDHTAGGGDAHKTGDPEAQCAADHADQHIGDQTHLSVGFHDDARQPADDTTDDQGDDPIHFVYSSLERNPAGKPVGPKFALAPIVYLAGRAVEPGAGKRFGG